MVFVFLSVRESTPRPYTWISSTGSGMKVLLVPLRIRLSCANASVMSCTILKAAPLGRFFSLPTLLDNSSTRPSKHAVYLRRATTRTQDPSGTLGVLDYLLYH
jgi:hypothetical protein